MIQFLKEMWKKMKKSEKHFCTLISCHEGRRFISGDISRALHRLGLSKQAKQGDAAKLKETRNFYQMTWAHFASRN